MKVGGNDIKQTNTRIIAATNKNILERMKKGLFRDDLYYRLSVVRITIPPLRQRGHDILLFANEFLKCVCDRQHKKEVSLTEDAKEFLLNYQWPGNVRELNNLLEGIVSISSSDLISADIIIKYLRYEEPEPMSSLQARATDSAELEQMKQALREHRGNRCKAAESIGMSRSTFYRRLREYCLDKGKRSGTL